MKTYQVTIIRNAGVNVFNQPMERKEVTLPVQAGSIQDAYRKGADECIRLSLINFNGMEMTVLVDGIEERDERY